MKRILKTAGLTAIMALPSSAALAHPSFLANNFYTTDIMGTQPEALTNTYVEGTSAYLEFNPGHGCGHEAYMPPVENVTMILPNNVTKFHGTDLLLSENLETTSGEASYGANVLMGVRAQLSGDWKKVETIVDSVPSFYNHGLREKDIKAIHWMGAAGAGKTKGMDGNYEFALMGIRASLPKIQADSCITEITVRIPTIMYCKKVKNKSAGGVYDTANAWLLKTVDGTPFSEGHYLAQFKDGQDTDGVSEANGFASSFKIVRKESNPLPGDGHCGEGLKVAVYPNDADMKTLMNRKLNKSVKFGASHAGH